MREAGEKRRRSGSPAYGVVLQNSNIWSVLDISVTAAARLARLLADLRTV